MKYSDVISIANPLNWVRNVVGVFSRPKVAKVEIVRVGEVVDNPKVSEIWLALKHRWNTAYANAQAAADRVAADIQAECGQQVDPDFLLYKTGGTMPEYNSRNHTPEGFNEKGIPVKSNWEGSYSQFKISAEKLEKVGNYETLLALARNILLQ